MLLAGCFHQGEPATVTEPPAPAEENLDSRVDELSRQLGVDVSQAAEKAVLEAVDGSPSSGLATRDVVSTSMISMTVVANLPDLLVGQRYLAQLRDNGNIVELGELEMKKAGWLLERSINVDPLTYKTVEVYRDSDVILRGSFE